MANMGYCRWENTGKDMQDCVNALAGVDDVPAWYAGLSDYEREGVRQVLRCADALLELRQELPEL